MREKETASGFCANNLIRAAAIFAAIFLLQLCFLLPYSSLRMIARDEGFYLMTAKLAMQGQLPYAEFFYPQMPFLPYFYGGWMKFFGYTWTTARAISAFLTAALGGLIYLKLLGKRGHIAAAIGFILYSASSLTYPWFVTTKPYILSTLLIFAAYMMAERAKPAPFLSGLFIALAAITRLHLILLWPIFAFKFWRIRNPERKAVFLNLCLGTLLPFLIITPLVFRDMDAFLFNNVNYHLLRSSLSIPEALNLKRSLLLTLFGFRTARIFDNFQFLLLVVGTFLYLIIRKRQELDLALPLAISLFVVSLLPTPAYAQYFCAPIPFLAVCAAQAPLQRHPSSRTSRLAINAAIALTLLCYLHPSLYFWRKYTVLCESGSCYGGAVDASEWSLETLHLAAKEINRLTGPGEAVFAQWPGVLFESHAVPLAGSENQFGRHIARKLSAAKRHRFHVLSRSDEMLLLSEKRPRLVILRKNTAGGDMGNRLLKLGYHLETVIGDAHLFILPQPSNGLYPRTPQRGRSAPSNTRN